jgi:hypothetical protein
MKKYVAFANQQFSGIVTKEEAQKWAANYLSKHPNLAHVHVAEVLEVVERQESPIATRPYIAPNSISLATVKQPVMPTIIRSEEGDAFEEDAGGQTASACGH